MNNRAEITPESIQQRHEAERIKEIMATKLKEYQAAMEVDNFDRADAIVDEYNNLSTELRYNDPNVELIPLETYINKKAESLTKAKIIKDRINDSEIK